MSRVILRVHYITLAVRVGYFLLFFVGKFTLTVNSIVVSYLQYIFTITADTIFTDSSLEPEDKLINETGQKTLTLRLH